MTIIDLALNNNELKELEKVSSKYKMGPSIYANLIVCDLLSDIDRLESIEEDLYQEDDDEDLIEEELEETEEELTLLELELSDEEDEILKTFSENTNLELFVALRYLFLEAFDDERDLS